MLPTLERLYSKPNFAINDIKDENTHLHTHTRPHSQSLALSSLLHTKKKKRLLEYIPNPVSFVHANKKRKTYATIMSTPSLTDNNNRHHNRNVTNLTTIRKTIQFVSFDAGPEIELDVASDHLPGNCQIGPQNKPSNRLNQES